ncbi:hypothetical protein ACVDG5_036855 [Mesorhizobium sp. ORM6]
MTIFASRSGQSGLPASEKTIATTHVRSTAANTFAMISPKYMCHSRKQTPAVSGNGGCL